MVCASRFTQIVNQFILPLLYVSNAAVFVSSFLFIILGALPAVLCVAWMLCGCSRVRELYLKAMLRPRVCAQGAGCSRLTRRRLWGPRQQCSSSVSY